MKVGSYVKMRPGAVPDYKLINVPTEAHDGTWLMFVEVGADPAFGIFKSKNHKYELPVAWFAEIEESVIIEMKKRILP